MAPPPPQPSPAAEIMGSCLAGRTRLLNRAITGLYDESLRAVGVTAAQLTTLSFVHELGPIAPGEIARTLMIEKSTLSRNLGRMERHGWISIAQGEAGHTQVIAITRRGRALIARALPRWERAQARARELLGEGGADAVIEAFNSVRARGAYR
ncbi:MAG: MarR family transcriptional regulator [Planctomycetota bacterium]